VQPREGQQQGVVIVEASGRTSTSWTASASTALTSSDPGYPHGGAVFHDTAVWIRKG